MGDTNPNSYLPRVYAVILSNVVMIETSDQDEVLKQHSEDMSNGSTTSHATISHDAESKVDFVDRVYRGWRTHAACVGRFG